MVKWIIGILVVIALGLALWWSGWLGTFSTGAPTQNTQATTTPEQAQTQTQTDLPTASNDASDAALVQDTASVDANIQALTNDSSSLDQSLNDKPGAQEF